MSSFFSFDPEQAKGMDFSPLPVGEYECIVSKTEATASSAGNPMVKVTLTVRDDVEQEGGKRKIFDNIVFTDNAMFKVHQFAGAIGMENAESIEDFAQKALYKPVRIKNKHETYNNKVNDKVALYIEAAVEYEGQGGTSADPFAGSESIDISDEDLPF